MKFSSGASKVGPGQGPFVPLGGFFAHLEGIVHQCWERLMLEGQAQL